MRSSRLFTLLALSFTLTLLLSSTSALVAAQDASSSSSSSSNGSGSGTNTNASGQSASDLLKQGIASMSSGQFHSAIQSFDEAIQLDPTAYLSYYRRATASLSLGRTSAALKDLDHLISLNPSFAQAHFSRANVLTKEGELSKAQDSIETFLKLKPKDSRGEELKKKIANGLEQAARLRASWEFVLEKGIKKGKEVAADAGLKKKAEECLNAASSVLEISPNHLEARNWRAECRLALGELDEAIGDWSGIIHLSPSIDLLLRLSSLKYYILGDSPSSREAGLSHLKACLTSDPDNKTCAKAHRKMRSIEKAVKKAEKFAEGGTWRPVLSALKGAKVGGPTVIDDVVEAIKADAEPRSGVEGGEAQEPLIPSSIKQPTERSGLLHYLRKLHCRAHTELHESKKAKPYCEAVLSREPEDPWALVHKGDEALKEERYEDAVRHLSTASEKAGGQDQSILTKLQKAQRLLKQSNTKDYYKILGVSRDVDAASLKKAYRRLAKEHHPDKGGSAEKMAAINEAFDVLGNEEKRAQFDAGVDPNDPMAGASGHPGQGSPFVFQQGPAGGGGGGHPFAHFFQQGGGGGGGQQFFQQKFTHFGGRGGGGGGGGAAHGHFPFDF